MADDKLFGTDGIRDIAGRGHLSPEQIVRTAKAIGYLLDKEPELFRNNQDAASDKLRIVTTRDTRASGYMIEGALRAGLLASGVDVISADVLPTPVCSFLVRKFNCPCGIVISASHNPNEYNGIKLFNGNGHKISTRLEKRIEEIVNKTDIIDSFAPNVLGAVEEHPDAAELYIDDIVSTIINDLDLRGMKIVIDCANGAVTETAPAVLNHLGAETFCINAEPDGTNINVDSGALHPKQTAQTLKKLKADAGFSFDGDGDRVILVDDKGFERDGDYIMAICGRYLKEKSRLSANMVVSTVMSNIGLELSLKEKDIKLVRTKVGDRFVTEEMLKQDAILGGEQSGHILLLDKSPTGDGLWTALIILQIMKNTGKSLSKLSSCMKKYPQKLINVNVNSKPNLDSLPEVKIVMDKVRKDLGDGGRVILRYSGTEPLARVMVEGPDQDSIENMAQNIANAIERTIG